MRRARAPSPATRTALASDECVSAVTYTRSRPSTPSSRHVGLARCSAASSATSAAEDAESWITPPPPPPNLKAGSRPSASANASIRACSTSVAAGEVDQSIPWAPSPPENRSPRSECSEALAGK